MSLIKCPDCGEMISNRAEICIHCGCPIAKSKETSVGPFKFDLNEDGESYSVSQGTHVNSAIMLSGTYAADKKVTFIAENGFCKCNNITTLLINNIPSIGKCAFEGCENLKSIVLRDVTFIGERAFANCESLESVIIISDKRTTIEIGAFSHCSNLKEAFLPDGLCWIDSGVFEFCRNLEKLVVPTNINFIGDHAFFCCENLTNINIPKSVKFLYRSAFGQCEKLNLIRYEGSKEEWNSIKKYEKWDSYTSDYIICCSDGKIKKKDNG